MLFMGRIGYLRAVKFGGRIGRIYPVEVKARGYKGEVESRKCGCLCSYLLLIVVMRL